jgi:hypothetical protein
MADPEKPVDQRGRLEDHPFDYQITKDKRILISFHGKVVTILAGLQAQKLITHLINEDEEQIQLVLARATGNFKHGNERRG